MDKKQLKEDLVNLSLEEVCSKYELSLGDLFKLSSDLYTYMDDDDKFLVMTKGGKWIVSKYIGGEHCYFGVYEYNDAVRVRDELIKVNWDKDELDKILFVLGVNSSEG